MCGPVVLPKEKKNKFLSSARPPESDKFAAMFATPSWNCSLNFQVTCRGIEEFFFFFAYPLDAYF